MPIYIIEHLEDKMWKWCIIEYKHISKIVGKENLWITNVKRCKALNNYSKVIPVSVSRLNLKNACILDPEADKTLAPEEAKRFDYFIFGGILGDNPPAKKTKTQLTSLMSSTPSRNLGKGQMSTDNAVYTVKKIAEGTHFEKLAFRENIEIPFKKNESLLLPYTYNLIENKPLISRELLTYLKKKRGF